MSGAGDHECDVVVVGSGGGLAGALAAAVHGLDVLVVEKTSHVGGSTALSGGTWWAPANPLLAKAGVTDSPAQARAYLDAVVGHAGPSTSAARKDAYVRGGIDLFALLVAEGVRLGYSDGWPDYYAEAAGGIARGRTIHGQPFDGHRLGEYEDWLRPTRLFLAANSVEVAALALGKRTWRAFRISARVVLRSALAKLRRQKLLTRGQSLMAQLLLATTRRGVTIWRDTAVAEITMDGGRATGVVVEREGQRVRVVARRGVLLAAGGFAHNTAMRKEHQPEPVGAGWSMAQPGDTGEVLQAAMATGAATDLLDESWWVPGTAPPEGVMLHVWDRCFPHSMIVDTMGTRFMNEAAPYMDAGQRMIARHSALGADHSWLILESRHRRRYAFGMAPPGITPKGWIESGYLKKASTIAELAALCGIDPAALQSSVDRLNGFATSGVDADFHRGETAIEHYYGDYRSKPNPNLGPILEPPFYAAQVFPGDVGTAGGLVTDEHGRVLDTAGAAIQGLYAAGNITASVMGRTYPGAGASIGASLVFSYLAAEHMAAASPLTTGGNS